MAEKVEPTLLWGQMTNQLASYIYQTARLNGRWASKKKGLTFGETVACIHAHISRMWMFGSEPDPDMPELTQFETGLADAILELMEWCGAHKIDLGGLVLKRATWLRKTVNKQNKEKQHDWNHANAKTARLI